MQYKLKLILISFPRKTSVIELKVKPNYNISQYIVMFVVSIHTDPDEMIYDDVELGEEGGCNSSLDTGWSSSEFESYDEASDEESRPENGLPHAFMRGKPPQRKTHVCKAITLLFPSQASCQ